MNKQKLAKFQILNNMIHSKMMFDVSFGNNLVIGDKLRKDSKDVLKSIKLIINELQGFEVIKKHIKNFDKMTNVGFYWSNSFLTDDIKLKSINDSFYEVVFIADPLHENMWYLTDDELNTLLKVRVELVNDLEKEYRKLQVK